MSEINDLNETYEEEMDDAEVITVPIDDTLSNSGEAADAAAVGAALALKANRAEIVAIDVNGQGADNQGHILVDGSDIKMGGTDTRTIKNAVTAAEGRTGETIPLNTSAGAPSIAQAISQAGNASADTIPMEEGGSTTIAQKISAMDSVAAANSTAITQLQGKTAETILMKAGEEETIEAAMLERVKSVNGEKPDSAGNVEVKRVMLAENLISELNQANTDTFSMRTAGGDASIESGSAWLLSARGNSVHTGYEAESLEMTVTEAGTGGHISASIDRDEFVEAVGESGTTTMTYDEDHWEIGSSTIDPADYGVTVTGTPVDGDEIEVVYSAEVRGSITPVEITGFTATGWNLYNHTGGYARVKKYSDTYGYKISGAYTALKYSETYSGTQTSITVTDGAFTVPGDGYVWVTGGDATTTAIWATWEDWTSDHAGDFAAYSESSIDLSSVMSARFPYGLLKAGSARDEINLNTSQAISRVERMAYSASNLATAKASGREYEYDEDYIYLARAEETVNTLTGVSGAYTANDHGLEWFDGTDVDVPANFLYGNNLKNKLERDVLTMSSQTLSSGQKGQVQSNLGLVPTQQRDIGFDTAGYVADARVINAINGQISSRTWTPSSGSDTILNFVNSIDKQFLPVSFIKTGSVTPSDCPFETDEFTGIVTGNGDKIKVTIKPYKATNNNIEYSRDISQDSWLESGWDTLNTWRPYQVKSYSYSCPSIAAGSYKEIKASDLQISTPDGYEPVAVARFSTGTTVYTASYINAQATGDEMAMQIANNTSGTVTARTVQLDILYMHT